MSADVVIVDRPCDGVAVVTMHRPDARNALNHALRRSLFGALVELDADESVAAVVLTGTDPAFCAGLDLKELAADPGDLDRTVVAATPRRAGPIPEMTTPLVGAVNGVAVTGGLELALACDFLVASERARFADTHARVGIMPGWGMSVRLPDAVGVRRAREMSSTGNFVDATTALRWGLVNRVVAHDDLMPTAVGLASDIAANDREAVNELMSIYTAGRALTQRDATALEIERARAWLSGRADRDLETRRREVIERGRAQL